MSAMPVDISATLVTWSSRTPAAPASRDGLDYCCSTAIAEADEMAPSSYNIVQALDMTPAGRLQDSFKLAKTRSSPTTSSIPITRTCGRRCRDCMLGRRQGQHGT